MKYKILILLSLLATIVGCEKDKLENAEINKSSLQVQVLDLDKNPINGAKVIIVDPSNLSQSDLESIGNTKLTNSEGIAVFSVDTGNYAISAFKEGVGEAGTFIEIMDIKDHSIELILMPEDFVNYPPQIQRVAPSESIVTVSSIDKVNLKLMVTDDHSEYSNINVKVECETDGVIFEGNPNSANIVEIEVADLAKGNHNLSITATDEHNVMNTSVFFIDVSIVVPVELSVEKVNRQSVLSWSEILEPDFEKLVIERYNPNEYGAEYEVIATITEKTDISFTDTIPPIAEYIDYRVTVHDTDFRKSEESIARIELPMGPFFELGYYSVTHAILHPNQDWVYINVNDDANKIIIYDFANEQIVKEIDFGYEPRYPVIADNGEGLQVFVPGDNSAINIYSADENFTLIKTINTMEDVNNVVPNGSGILIAGMDNYYYNYRDYHIRTFSQSTGELLDSIGDRYGKARIVGDPINKNLVYGFERTTSNYARIKSEIDNNGKFIHYEYDNSYDYRIDQNRNLFVTPTGEYFITSYVAYSTSDFSIDTEIGTVSHNGITFNDDASFMYTCSSNNEKIFIYSYPSFQLVSEIETRTTPSKILYRDNKIITVGYENGNYIVEVYNLSN